jgi:hypothetical protein
MVSSLSRRSAVSSMTTMPIKCQHRCPCCFCVLHSVIEGRGGKRAPLYILGSCRFRTFPMKIRFPAFFPPTKDDDIDHCSWDYSSALLSLHYIYLLPHNKDDLITVNENKHRRPANSKQKIVFLFFR